jgi:hypothetical protein
MLTDCFCWLAAACDHHHFKAEASDAACTECPPAPHEPGNTGITGATSQDDCQCQVGYGKVGDRCYGMMQQSFRREVSQ